MTVLSICFTVLCQECHKNPPIMSLCRMMTLDIPAFNLHEAHNVVLTSIQHFYKSPEREWKF